MLHGFKNPILIVATLRPMITIPIYNGAFGEPFTSIEFLYRRLKINKKDSYA